MIILSSPTRYGTSIHHSIECLRAAEHLWGLELYCQVDPYRENYFSGHKHFGTIIGGNPLCVEPGMYFFTLRSHPQDYLAYISYPEYNQTEAFEALAALCENLIIDRVGVITISFVPAEGKPNISSRVHTAFPAKNTMDDHVYVSEADPFLGPVEYYFTRCRQVPVFYVSLDVTDEETSWKTTDFYRSRLSDIKNYVPFVSPYLASEKHILPPV